MQPPRTMEPLGSFLLVLVSWLTGAHGLREVQLIVPGAVSVGDTVPLGCKWSLEPSETLYSVKWYRGRQEFFRYIPKELPHTRVFPQQGITVDISRSGPQQVVLRGATRGLAGRYRCEVSADAPSFHTEVRSAYIHVVELPEAAPTIRAEKGWYAAGTSLRAHCSSPPADPPANLTWLLNGNEVKGYAISPIQLSSAKPHQHESSLEDVNTIIFSPWNTLPGYEEPVTDNVIDIPAIATYNASRYWTPDPTTGGTKFQSRYQEKNIDRSISPEEKYDSIVNLQGTSEFKTSADGIDLKNSPEGRHDLKAREGQESKAAHEVLNGTELEEKSNKTSSASQLVLRVQSQHFRKGRLNLTCVAKVYSVYSAKAELVVEEERPQIAPVMGSRDSNAGHRTGCATVSYCVALGYILSCCLKTSLWLVSGR